MINLVRIQLIIIKISNDSFCPSNANARIEEIGFNMVWPGVAYGDKAQAIHFLKQSLKLNKDFDQAKKDLKRLTD